MNLRREVRFEAGYDKVAEGKGRHGMQIRFLLHGQSGAVQFLMYTDWLPGDAPSIGHYREAAGRKSADMFPMAADLGHHWRSAPYEGCEHGPCDVVDGGCYYDGSSLNAERLLAVLFDEGDEGVWRELGDYYVSLGGVR